MFFRGKFSFLFSFFQGLCMGAADIVPGISGGTIAFLMGFYEKLIASLKNLNKKAFFLLIQGKGRSFLKYTNFSFLFFLSCGILFSVSLLAGLVDYILNIEIYSLYLYSFFSGLVLASFLIVFRAIPVFKGKEALALLFGGILAFVLTTTSLTLLEKGPFYEIPLKAPFETISFENVDKEKGVIQKVPLKTISIMFSKGLLEENSEVYQGEKTFLIKELLIHKERDLLFFLDPWVVFSGMVGISAMLLPGISGSYLLNILGVYPLIIEALADFTKGLQKGVFEESAFFVLFNLVLGIILGASLFSHVVAFLFKEFRSLTLSLLSGFMIGALPSIWPFRSCVFYLNPLHLEKGGRLLLQEAYCPSLVSPLFWQGGFFVVIGCALVLIIEKAAKKSNH